MPKANGTRIKAKKSDQKDFANRVRDFGQIVAGPQKLR